MRKNTAAAIVRSIAFAPSLSTPTDSLSHDSLPLAALFDWKSNRARMGSSSPASAAEINPQTAEAATPDLSKLSLHESDADANPQATTPDLSKLEKFAYQKGDALFGYIEESQTALSDDGTAHFGRFLDAGTGSHSLRWIASLVHRDRLLADCVDHGARSAPRASLASYTAVTADATMRRKVLDEARALGVAGAGEVVIGNWQAEAAGAADDGPPALLAGRTFDTILADYLVGAIDGFAPYFQDRIFRRLAPHLAPGGRLYVVGLQPIPDEAPGDADVFCRITKVRDACIKLAGHRCYREYPQDWIERQIEGAGMTVVAARRYPIRYDKFTMIRQINVARSKLKLFPSTGLAREMGKVLDGLEKESAAVTEKHGGRITLGFDYVVVAERPKE